MRERAVRMVWEAIDEAGGVRSGVIPRVGRQLGIGAESLRAWVNQAGFDRGKRSP
jgi:transposase-like protein